MNELRREARRSISGFLVNIPLWHENSND